jgi:hypothetical protein
MLIGSTARLPTNPSAKPFWNLAAVNPDFATLDKKTSWPTTGIKDAPIFIGSTTVDPNEPKK